MTDVIQDDDLVKRLDTYAEVNFHEDPELSDTAHKAARRIEALQAEVEKWKANFDLRDADLSGADLSGADLGGACPVKIENIHQRVYEAASRDGALNMCDWHNGNFCGTTHCRAGWVTHLAGEGGRALDFALGTSAAAALIYMASDPTLERIPDFHCSNEAALEDMKRLAELEASKQPEAVKP